MDQTVQIEHIEIIEIDVVQRPEYTTIDTTDTTTDATSVSRTESEQVVSTPRPSTKSIEGQETCSVLTTDRCIWENPATSVASVSMLPESVHSKLPQESSPQTETRTPVTAANSSAVSQSSSHPILITGTGWASSTGGFDCRDTTGTTSGYCNRAVTTNSSLSYRADPQPSAFAELSVAATQRNMLSLGLLLLLALVYII